MLKELNAKVDAEDMIVSLNTDELPVKQDEAAINGVERLALKLREYDNK